MDKNLKKYKKHEQQIILIQKIIRGYLVRKELTRPTDSFTTIFLKKC